MIINNVKYNSWSFVKVKFTVVDTRRCAFIYPLHNLINYINKIQANIKVNFEVSKVYVNDSRKFGVKFGYRHGYKFEAYYDNSCSDTIDVWLESVFDYARKLGDFCGTPKVNIYINKINVYIPLDTTHSPTIRVIAP